MSVARPGIIAQDNLRGVMAINLEIGEKPIALEVEPERLVTAYRACEPIASNEGATLFQRAFTIPTRFPALHLALTPDDVIAIVVDAWRHVEGACNMLLEELRRAGVRADNVTFVGPSGEEPPVSVQGCKTERHDPTNVLHRCYVATTKNGRRIYLNRTIVEADQVIVLAETRFDADFGISGGPLAIFPVLADLESQAGWRAISASDLREMAEEVAWLLGTVFYVHIIAGPGDSISQVIGGGPDTFTDARVALNERWRLTLEQRADIVVAIVTLRAASINDVVRALTSARRAVQPGGTIILCLDCQPSLGDAFQELSIFDSPEAAQRGIDRTKADDGVIASKWLRAVTHARVAILSGWPDEIVEGLFATALTKASQIQKLVDQGGTVVILNDAQRVRVVAKGDVK